MPTSVKELLAGANAAVPRVDRAEAEATGRRVGGAATPVVGDPHCHRLSFAHDLDSHPGGLRVPENVGRRLRDDRIRDMIDVGR